MIQQQIKSDDREDPGKINIGYFKNPSAVIRIILIVCAY